MRAVWGMTFLLSASAACSDTTQLMHPVDAGVDAGPDAGLPDAGPPDAGSPDAGPPDAGPPDAGPPDAGPPDAGRPDAGVPDAGWSGMWQPLGPPLGHEAQVYPAMALDGSGAPLVAYVELIESPGVVATELHVARWSGTTWEPLGGTIASSTDRLPTPRPSSCVSPSTGQGRPVLAFGDPGRARRWAPSRSRPGPSTGARGRSSRCRFPRPSSAASRWRRGADGQVRLVLATGHELRVLVLGASGWSEVLSPLVDDAGVSEPDLALAGDGTPVLAFSEAASPGSFGSLRAFRWSGRGWSDLGLPVAAKGRGCSSTRHGSASGPTAGWWSPRRSGSSTSSARSRWAIAVPVFALGEGGWSVLERDGVPGGAALSEPIPGSPVDLQLSSDVPVVVSTGADGGVSLRALLAPGASVLAPVLGGLGAGTLLLLPDGSPLVGAVTPVSPEIGPEQADGGQVQILHFTGTPASLVKSSPRRSR